MGDKLLDIFTSFLIDVLIKIELKWFETVTNRFVTLLNMHHVVKHADFSQKYSISFNQLILLYDDASI